MTVNIQEVFMEKIKKEIARQKRGQVSEQEIEQYQDVSVD